MSETILYGTQGSPYVRSAQLALEEKGAVYDFSAVPFGTWGQMPHVARHPFGRVPAFEHQGFALYETQAIMRYADAVFPGPSLQPTDPRQAGRMNQIIGIVDCYVFPNISVGISFQRLIAKRVGMTADEAKVEASLPKARVCLEALDQILDGNRYLAGDALSLADLMLAPHYFWFALTAEGRDLLGPHEGLRRWWQAMETRESIKKTEPKLG
ncbi:MAG TPA: glutathione S-transferase family protein [Stellaceae bacterium]|nr:glutathione S-transferase family protein [Stellaceae bacterium]